jgi:hypothetical protein
MEFLSDLDSLWYQVLTVVFLVSLPIGIVVAVNSNLRERKERERQRELDIEHRMRREFEAEIAQRTEEILSAEADRIAKVEDEKEAVAIEEARRRELSEIEKEHQAREEREQQDSDWVSDWLGQLRDIGNREPWDRRVVILAAGYPKEFRELVARSVGVPVTDVASVFGCAATEEYLMEAQGAVDVVVVSPELREPDVVPMAEFVDRVYPGIVIVVVVRGPKADRSHSNDLPGIDVIVGTAAGPAALRDAVQHALSASG